MVYVKKDFTHIVYKPEKERCSYEMGLISPGTCPMIQVPFGDMQVWVGNFITQDTIDIMYRDYKDIIMERPDRAYSLSWGIQYNKVEEALQGIIDFEQKEAKNKSKRNLITNILSTVGLTAIGLGVLSPLVTKDISKPQETFLEKSVELREEIMTPPVTVSNTPELSQSNLETNKATFAAVGIGIVILLLLI